MSTQAKLLRGNDLQKLDKAFIATQKAFTVGERSDHAKIYNDCIKIIKTDIDALRDLNSNVGDLSKAAKVINNAFAEMRGALISLAQTTKDPVKQQALLDNMAGLMGIFGYARNQITREQVIAERNELKEQVTTSYTKGEGRDYEHYKQNNTNITDETDLREQYAADCKARIKGYERDTLVKLNEKEPILNIQPLIDVIKKIQDACKRTNEKEVCDGALKSLEGLKSTINSLTTKGLTTREAEAHTLGINQVLQVFERLLNASKTSAVQKIVTTELPALYEQVQAINLTLEITRMRCEIDALHKMQGVLSGTPNQDPMLGDDLSGPPITLSKITYPSQLCKDTLIASKRNFESEEPEITDAPKPF